jgi:adapter protein MecA 1/2
MICLSFVKIVFLTDEYAQDILVGAERKAFIQEHGICILKNDALQQLRQL